jgi:hypothetical protein
MNQYTAIAILSDRLTLGVVSRAPRSAGLCLTKIQVMTFAFRAQKTQMP